MRRVYKYYRPIWSLAWPVVESYVDIKLIGKGHEVVFMFMRI